VSSVVAVVLLLKDGVLQVWRQIGVETGHPVSN
jgi:hypothetical protein